MVLFRTPKYFPRIGSLAQEKYGTYQYGIFDPKMPHYGILVLDFDTRAGMMTAALDHRKRVQLDREIAAIKVAIRNFDADRTKETFIKLWFALDPMRNKDPKSYILLMLKMGLIESNDSTKFIEADWVPKWPECVFDFYVWYVDDYTRG